MHPNRVLPGEELAHVTKLSPKDGICTDKCLRVVISLSVGVVLFGAIAAVVVTQLLKTSSDCTSAQFYCSTAKQCIASQYQCDGIEDCIDDEDELSCSTSCTSDEYYCSQNSNIHGFCIPSSWRCDTQNDCLDGSDENGCNYGSAEHATFLCNADTVKVKPSQVCNGISDCTGGQDENNCIISNDGTGGDAQIYHPETNSYNSICSNSWDSSKSGVVCQALGFSGADSFESLPAAGSLVTSTSSLSNAMTLTDITPASCTSNAKVDLTCTAHTTCGVQQHTSRIVGGVATAIEQQPWTIVLQQTSDGEFSNICGGSIVSTNRVVTAAHCVSEITSSQYSLYRLMSGVSSPTTQTGTISFIQNILVHPSYSSDTSVADAAIIQLTTPLTYGNTKQPICLPTPKQIFAVDSTATVAGWGLLTENGDEPTTLQSVEVSIIEQSTCRIAYPHLTDLMICAGDANGGKDACQGDSGGPLVVEVNGKWTLVGIVSYGRGCAEAQYPGVYVKVSELVDWIRKNL